MSHGLIATSSRPNVWYVVWLDHNPQVWGDVTWHDRHLLLAICRRWHVAWRPHPCLRRCHVAWLPPPPSHHCDSMANSDPLPGSYPLIWVGEWMSDRTSSSKACIYICTLILCLHEPKKQVSTYDTTRHHFFLQCKGVYCHVMPCRAVLTNFTKVSWSGTAPHVMAFFGSTVYKRKWAELGHACGKN